MSRCPPNSPSPRPRPRCTRTGHTARTRFQEADQLPPPVVHGAATARRSAVGPATPEGLLALHRVVQVQHSVALDDLVWIVEEDSAGVAAEEAHPFAQTRSGTVLPALYPDGSNEVLAVHGSKAWLLYALYTPLSAVGLIGSLWLGLGRWLRRRFDPPSAEIPGRVAAAAMLLMASSAANKPTAPAPLEEVVDR